MQKGRCVKIDGFTSILVGVVCLLVGLLVGYILRKTIGERAIGSAEQTAKNLILDAEKKADTIRKEIALEAKEEAHRLRSDVDKEIKDRRAEMTRLERRVIQKEENPGEPEGRCPPLASTLS